MEYPDICHSVYVIALAAGFLVTFFSVPNVRINIGNIEIFLLKCRMHRENTLRGARMMPRIKPLLVLCAALLT